jgi:small GTP-binding protein
MLGGFMELKRMKVKVCLVGEAAVGKTSLIRRFVLDNFDDKYIQTLGTKVSKKEISIKGEASGEMKIDMTIWDIMGQKGFRELLKEAYFYGAKGILAVCDSTRRKTLEDLDDWIEGVYSVTGRIPIEFLANKVDLKDQAQITEDDLVQAAKAYDSPFHFTSAKMGVNVEIAFQSLAERIARERSVRKLLAEE